MLNWRRHGTHQLYKYSIHRKTNQFELQIRKKYYCVKILIKNFRHNVLRLQTRSTIDFTFLDSYVLYLIPFVFYIPPRILQFRNLTVAINKQPTARNILIWFLPLDQRSATCVQLPRGVFSGEQMGHLPRAQFQGCQILNYSYQIIQIPNPFSG